jgi:GNAT superfamily N-acetyltransferase
VPERLRLFRAADFEACYAISLATGFEGDDAAYLYRDPKLMGHIYLAPYALLEPALAFVVEDRDGVAGFAVGTTHTVAWEDRLARDWWPSLRRQYADPANVPAEARTPDQRRAFMIHHPSRTPVAVTGAHPAHPHMDLLPRLQGRGVGSRLLGLWLEKAANVHIHVGVNRANRGGARFWLARGFRELPVPSERTLWMGRAAG